MLRPDVSRRATRDLRDIWIYIARDDRAAADRMQSELREAIDRLCDFPQIGHIRDDLTPRPLLFWTVHPYLIAYQRQGRRLRVVRVVHGKRDLGSLFR